MEPATIDVGSTIITAPIAESKAGRTTESDTISVAYYENQIPPFVEDELARLYENVFSSLAKCRIEGMAGSASAYVVRQGGKPITIFLFRCENGKVEIINQVIKIDEDDVRRFAQTMFSAFQSVNVISFHAVQATLRQLSFPYQRFNCLEDIVLTLPETPQQYLDSLGKNMRTSIKRYLKKLKLNFSSFHYEFYTDGNISEQHLREIVRLSSARMAVKNQVSAHSEEKTEQLVRLVKSAGLVGVATIDGRVCAGVICSRSGANYFMHVIAHDPAYDDYRLGKVCCYLSICECIQRAGKEFHFLWGRYEYKYRLLGVQRDLDHIAIYRSRLQLLLNGDVALMNAFKGYGRQAKRWLLSPERLNGVIGRIAAKLAARIRHS